MLILNQMEETQCKEHTHTRNTHDNRDNQCACRPPLTALLEYARSSPCRGIPCSYQQ